MRVSRFVHIPADVVAGILAIGLMTLVAIVTLFIMFYPIPKENETLVGQGYGSILSLMGLIVGYFYGTTTGASKDRDTISTLANTANTAQTTLSAVATPSSDGVINLKPGETAVAQATAAGAAIIKEGVDDAAPPAHAD